MSKNHSSHQAGSQRNDSEKVTPAHVLLVDDEVLELTTLAQGLRERGYRVSIADSGEEALRQIDEDAPDLAVLDAWMPGMTGVELASRLNAGSGVPFMLLSAHDDPDVVRLATELGALAYLVKPIAPEHLFPAIEAALARASDLHSLHRQREQLRALVARKQQISMAIGILIERHRLSRTQAFEVIRNRARKQRRRLEQVATEVVNAAELVNLSDEERNAAKPPQK